MNLLHPLRLPLLAALAGTCLAAQANGQVEIRFADTASFADAGSTVIERDRTCQSLSQYLQRLGRRLPDGQTLKVEITDLDLAGWPRMGRHGDLRILRGGADWPRITLRYELLDQGRSVRTGSDELQDLGYLASARPAPREDLPYEKRLLADWFDQRFTTHRP